MRILVRVVLFLVVALGALLGVLFVAAESGEVIVLTANGVDGPKSSRLWVIDHKDTQWLRGNPNSSWARRVANDSSVSMERNGQTAPYTAVFVPEEVDAINKLTREKYGWADAYVSTIFPTQDGTAVRLDPKQ